MPTMGKPALPRSSVAGVLNVDFDIFCLASVLPSVFLRVVRVFLPAALLFVFFLAAIAYSQSCWVTGGECPLWRPVD